MDGAGGECLVLLMCMLHVSPSGHVVARLLLCAGPGIHFFGSSTFYLHEGGQGGWSPTVPPHPPMTHLVMPSPGYGGGVLAPPQPTSPTGSPTHPVQGSHSAQASPTNTLKTVRPRARSADESVSGKKVGTGKHTNSQYNIDCVYSILYITQIVWVCYKISVIQDSCIFFPF